MGLNMDKKIQLKKKNQKGKKEERIVKIDASGKTLGRLASQVAFIICGKNRPDFLPYSYQDIKVLINNLEKLKFSGKKIESKSYIHHSGYPGGLKSVKLAELFEKNPERVFRKAVYNMLPKNKLRSKMIKSLKLSRKDS